MAYHIGETSSTLTHVIERVEPTGTGKQWVVRKNSAGQNEILTTGDDGLLHYIAREEDSETGWATFPQSNSHQYNQLFVPTGSNRAYGIVVGKSINDLTKIYPLEIDEATKTVTAKEPISAGVSGGFVDASNINILSGDTKGSQDVFTQLAPGDPNLFFLFVDPETMSAVPLFNNGGIAPHIMGPILAASNGFAMNYGEIQVFARDVSDMSPEIRTTMNQNVVRITAKGSTIKMSDICVVRNTGPTQDNTKAYIVDWSANLYEIASTEITPGSHQYLQWQSQASPIAIAGLKSGADTQPSISGVADANGLIHLFALSNQCVLWHTRQMPDGNWSDWLPIGSDIASCVPTCTEDGAIEILCGCSAHPDTVTSLRYVESSSPEWIQEDIDVSAVASAQATGKLTPATLMSIPFFDDDDAPAAGQTVALTASFEVDAQVNGEGLTLDPKNACTAQTDINGCIQLTLPYRHADGLPLLTVNSTEMGLSDSAVDPRTPITKGLSTMTGANIAAYNCANPSNTITPSSWSTDQNDAFAKNLGSVFQSCHASGASALSAQGPSTSPGIHIKIGNGDPTLDFIEAHDFQALKTNAIANEKAFVAVLADIGLGDGLSIDWASVWHGITQGLVNVTAVAFQAAETVWNITVAGVEMAFTFAEKTLDNAYQMLSSVFVSIKTALEDILQWLITEFGRLLPQVQINAWCDFIKSSMKDGLTGFVSTLPKPSSLKPQTDAFLTKLGSEIDTILDPILSQPGVTETMAALSKSQSSMMDNSVFTPGGPAVNMLQHLLGQIAGASSDFNGLDPKMQATFDAMSQPFIVGAAGQNAAIDSLGGTFSAPFAQSGGRSAGEQFSSSDILNTLKSNGSSVSQLLSSVSNSFFDSADLMYQGLQNLPETMDTPFDLPFFSDLYKLIAGRQTAPSLLDVVVLCAAIPLTLALPGQAPMDTFTETRVGDTDQTQHKKNTVFAFSLLKSVSAFVTGQIPSPTSGSRKENIIHPKTMLRAMTASFGIIGSSIAMSVATNKGASKTLHGLFVYGLLDLLISLLDLATSWIYSETIPTTGIKVNVPQILSILEALAVTIVIISVFADEYLVFSKTSDVMVMIIDIILCVFLLLRAFPNVRKECIEQELYLRAGAWIPTYILLFAAKD